jgi:hypothetical protein
VDDSPKLHENRDIDFLIGPLRGSSKHLEIDYLLLACRKKRRKILVDVAGLEPAAPCLQSGEANLRNLAGADATGASLDVFFHSFRVMPVEGRSLCSDAS